MNGNSARRGARKALRRLAFESLEGRTLLSTILWTNRGSAALDSDGFGQWYGPDANTARAIVDEAISSWERVIQDFHFEDGGNTLEIEVNARPLVKPNLDEYLGECRSEEIEGGKVTRASITLDDNGAGEGWYMDASPSTNVEFSGGLRNRFFAELPTSSQNNKQQYDLLTTMTHELGHAVGLTLAEDAMFDDWFVQAGWDQTEPDPDKDYNLYRITTPRSDVTITSYGGGHLYEGTTDPSFPGNPRHPYVLMNWDLERYSRALISDLEAQLLADVYGYTILLPSLLETFPNTYYDPASPRVAINADPDRTTPQTITVDYRVDDALTPFVQVDVNGVRTEWEDVDVIRLHSGRGEDWVQILGTPENTVTIVDNAGGTDRISIGEGRLRQVRGAVEIGNAAGMDFVVDIDGSRDSLDYQVTVSQAGVQGLSPAWISWTGTALPHEITLKTGSGDDSLLITSAPWFTPITISMGGGADRLDVWRTSGPLTVDPGAGQNTVMVGSLAPILGGELMVWDARRITLTSDGANPGQTDLIVDDSGNTGSTQVTLGSSSLRVIESGHASGPWIEYERCTLSSLTVYTSSRSSTLDVEGTLDAITTRVETGPDSDIVNVRLTAGRLEVHSLGVNDVVNVGRSGSVQGINGAVVLASPVSYLAIDDSADSTGRVADLSADMLDGLAPAQISWPGGPARLEIHGGSGGNTWTVLDTPTITTLNCGRGDDWVWVGGSRRSLVVEGQGGQDSVIVGRVIPLWGGTLEHVGNMEVKNQSGRTALTVDDSGDGRYSAMVLTAMSLSTLYPGRLIGPWIKYQGSSLSALLIKGGKGGNQYDILSTPSDSAVDLTTTLMTGSGSDQVNVKNTRGRLEVRGTGGHAIVTIGSEAPLRGGDLSNIAGVVDVSSSGGSLALIVDDSGDTTARTATITSGLIAGMSPEVITYSGGNVASLSVLGPQAASTYLIPTTAAGTPLRLEPGPEANTIEVGAPAGRLNGIQGEVTLASPTAAGAVLIHDEANTSPAQFQLTRTDVIRSGAAAIHYGQAATLEIRGGNAGDTLTVTDMNPTPAVTFTGGEGIDVVVNGSNLPGYFQVTGTNAGQVAGVSFKEVESLLGGGGDDGFSLGVNGSIGGSIDGGGGTNKLDFPGRTIGVAVNLATGKATGVGGSLLRIQKVIGTPGDDSITGDDSLNVLFGNGGRDTLMGGRGNDRIVLGPAQAPGTTVDGGLEDFGGGDILFGEDVGNTWDIRVPGGGNLNGAIGFAGIEALIGGSGPDVFRVSAHGSIASGIDGRGGADRIDYTGFLARPVRVAVSVSSGRAEALGQFSSVESLIGSPQSDLLIGPNTNNVWNLSDTNSGDLNGSFTFSGVESLQGGTGQDRFRRLRPLAGPLSLTGSIDGGGGVNTLDNSAITTGVVVNLATGVATGIGLGIANIQNVAGSRGNDSLTGSAGDNILWSHGGVDVLNGGDGRDLIVLEGAQAGTRVDGGAGDDTIAGPSNTTNIWAIQTANAGVLNSAIKFAQVENLLGGQMSDVFRLSAGASLAGVAEGGLGIDQLDDSAFNRSVTLDLSAGTATGLGSISGIEAFIGSNRTDTLIASNTRNTWSLSGTNSGSLDRLDIADDFTFSGVENLRGGSRSDVFQFADRAKIDGWVDGGATTVNNSLDAINHLDFTAYRSGVTIKVGGRAGSTIRGAVTNFHIVSGGSGADRLTGDAANTIILGNDGNDVLADPGGRNLLIGGRGADTLTGGSGEDILVGASTIHDNTPRLLSVMAEWLGPSPYGTRIRHLTIPPRPGETGGLNGSVFLDTPAIVDDAISDLLTGGAGLDWFRVRRPPDRINDLATGELGG